MVTCSIRKCKSKSVKGGNIRFFSFPRKESVAKEWLRFCGPKTTVKHGRVCSNHFLPTDYFKSLKHILLNESPKSCRNLKEDAVPTLFIDEIGNQNTLSKQTEGNSESVGNSNIGNENMLSKQIEVNTEIVDNSDTGNQNILSKQIEINSETVDNSDTRNQNTLSKLIKVNSQIVFVIPKKNFTILPNEAAGSSKIVEESDDNNITIPLAEYKLLKKRVSQYEVLKENLREIFTPGQIRCLMKPDMRRVRWSAEDIAAAMLLRMSISPQGYRHLRDTVGIPLPSFSTLRKWVADFDTKEGLSENVDT